MIYKIVKRTFDLAVSSIIFLIMLLPMIIIGLFIRATSKGAAVFWSSRVGIDNSLFRMPKFRTMRNDAPQIATHLMKDPDSYVTGIGRILRKYSLDELPQLWSVVKGDMSLVGPRPALFNQDDLVALRTEKGIQRLRPGITGWAQVNGRDDLPIPVKVGFEEYYLAHRSPILDLKILIMTFFKVLRAEGVDH